MATEKMAFRAPRAPTPHFGSGAPQRERDRVDREVYAVAKRVKWSRFRNDIFHWRQGEHITLIGPTGTGKTTLINQLIDMRLYELFLGSKRMDETQDALKRMGFMVAKDADEIHVDISRRWFVKPAFSPKMTADQLRQANRDIFKDVLMRAYREGAWTVFVDEGRYIANYLGLQQEMVLLLTQGRSQHNSIVTGTQRPRHVPLEVYDQATHLFIWRDPDLQNVARIAEIAGVNRRQAQETVSQLQRHEFVYVNTVTGEMTISKVSV
jgi:ATP:corrinoid adenosyltransferase